jgi:hypothetical protein
VRLSARSDAKRGRGGGSDEFPGFAGNAVGYVLKLYGECPVVALKRVGRVNEPKPVVVAGFGNLEVRVQLAVCHAVKFVAPDQQIIVRADYGSVRKRPALAHTVLLGGADAPPRQVDRGVSVVVEFDPVFVCSGRSGDRRLVVCHELRDSH